MPECSRLAVHQGTVFYRRSDNVVKAASGASVEVRSGGFPINIFSDEAGLVPMANPVTLGGNAWLKFYVRPDDCEFDLLVQAPSGEFTSFTRTNVRALLQGRKEFAVDDYASFANAVADLTALGIGGRIVCERDFTIAGTIGINGLTGVIVEGIAPEVMITLGANVDQTVFQTDNAVDCIVRNLVINGNEANQTAPNVNLAGISIFRTTRVTLENVRVIDTMSDGFITDSSVDARLIDCEANGCRGHGFVTGGNLPRPSRLTFVRCRAIDCGDGTIPAGGGYPRMMGFDFEPFGDDTLLEDCYSEGSAGSGINVGTELAVELYRGLTFLNCTCVRNNASGLGNAGGLGIGFNEAHGSLGMEGIKIIGGRYAEEHVGGIVIDGGNDDLGAGRGVKSVIIDGVSVHDNDEYGIRLLGLIEDFTIGDSKSYDNDDGTNPGLTRSAGINVQATVNGTPKRIDIDHCDLYDDRGGGVEMEYGVSMTGTEDGSVTNCMARAVKTAGYDFLGSLATTFHDNKDIA